MRKRLLSISLVFSLILTTILGTASLASPAGGVRPDEAVDRSIYMDVSKPTAVRVAALMEQMTLEDKIAQMVQPEQKESGGGASPEEVKEYGIGSVLSGGGSEPPTGNGVEDWKIRVEDYIAASMESKFGIPVIYGVDAVHGHNNVEDAVIFPHNIGLGAAGNTALTRQVGEAAAEEIRATGIHWTFAPTLGVVHSERWGRFYESFGETAEIVSEMGAAYTIGFQGEKGTGGFLRNNKVAASAKHYLGEGITQNGVNKGDVVMDAAEFEQVLRDELLPPYEAAINAGVQTVMVSYNSINGVKCHEHYELVTEILKAELGFEGIVISDYNGVHELPGNSHKDKVMRSVNAGIDMFMEPNDWLAFMSDLKQLVEEGNVSEARIDDAVKRILTVKFDMGLFEEPFPEEGLLDAFGSKAHRDVARQAVRESLTLLKNDKIDNNTTIMEALADYNNILVAGHSADDIGRQCGGWTISWQGKTGAITEGTTILEGIRDHAPSGTTVSYSARGMVPDGAEAAVVVVGEDPYAESDGDRRGSELVLNDRDISVLETIREYDADLPIILVLVTGRPISIADVVEDCAAVVCAWLPGSEGDGVGEVLFGEEDFSGVSTVTWPWYGEDIEAKESDDSKVLFARGTGMTKDGASIVPGNQTEIGLKPEAPQAERTGPFDLEEEGYVIEAEWMDTNESWLVTTGSHDGVGYVTNWTGEWANGKWNIVVPKPGVYDITFTAAVTADTNNIKFYPENNNDNNNIAIPFVQTSGLTDYQEVTISDVVLTQGLNVIKVMNTQAGGPEVRLDKMEFTCTEEHEVVTPPAPGGGDGPRVQEEGVTVHMSSSEKSQDMSWYTTPVKIENKITPKDSLDLTAVDDAEMTTITIDLDKKGQTFLGMGTSLEESSVYNLAQLEPSLRRRFLKDLVDPVNGAGMTLFRLTIGTSDFTGREFYTYYDELATAKPDWYNTTGKGFSIQKDIDFQIIETVKELMEVAEECGVSDEIRFFASSWTPPGWMKEETSSSRSYPNNSKLLKGGSLSDDHIDDLAMYYVRYVEEYAKLGIPIYGMTLQNEPLLEINYPSCYITGEQEGKLAIAIKKAVAASDILAQNGINPKVWAFDHNFSESENYVTDMFQVPGAINAVDGVSFHDYSGPISTMQRVLDEYSAINENFTVNLTERSVWGTSGANSIVQYFRNGAISYNSWVTMLDSSIAPHQWVGTPDPTMFVRDKGSSFDYWATPEFYITGQFTRFIRPGDVKVDSNYGSTGTVTNVAFYNEETETVTAVVVNQTDSSQRFKVVCEGMQFIGEIPAKNTATYQWQLIEYVHEVPGSFAAAEAKEFSEDIQVTDGMLIPSGNNAYADYVIDAKEAGYYYVDIEMEYPGYTWAAPNKVPEFMISQDGKELAKLNGHDSVWSAGPVTRAVVYLEHAGVQPIRLQISEHDSVAVKEITFKKAKESYTVPGRITASEYHGIDFATITGESRDTLENTEEWGRVFYRIQVPEDGMYSVRLSAASEAKDNGTADCGFWILDVDPEQWDTELNTLMLAGTGQGWVGNNDFNYSNSWSAYVDTEGEVYLTEGEHVIAVKMINNFNMKTLSIGSSIDVVYDEIMEEQEDDSIINVYVYDGKFGSDISTKLELTGLPEGVSYSAEKKADDHLQITLHGNRSADFDSDLTVKILAEVVQNNSGNTYMNEGEFVITAIDDPETVSFLEASLPASAASATLVLSGGTWVNDPDALAGITLSGEGAEYYSIQSAEYLDASKVKLHLGYEKHCYFNVDMTAEIPITAYRDSSGNGLLTATIRCNADEAMPEPIIVTRNESVSLAEDDPDNRPYYQKGSLRNNNARGNKLDYFVDVQEAGYYEINLRISTNAGVANGLKINGGGSGLTVGGNLSTVSFANFYNVTNTVKDFIYLNAGQQTLEFETNGSGFVMAGCSIKALPGAQQIKADSPGAVTTLKADSFSRSDKKYAHGIQGSGDTTNIGYTAAGSSFDYAVNVEQPGNYTVSYEYATTEGGTSIATQIVTESGEKTLDTISTPATGSWDAYQDSDSAEIMLYEGQQTLRVLMQGNGINLRSITLTYTDAEIIVIDKSELQATYDQYRMIEPDHYTEASWAELAAALAAAKAVLDDDYAGEEDVAAALERLQAAKNGLTEIGQEVVDKEALIALYEAHKDKQREDDENQVYYTRASWEQFELALQQAGEIIQKEEAVQAEVDTAKAALEEAIEGLVLLVSKEETDKSVLAYLLAQIEKLEAEDYEAEGWQALAEVVSRAGQLMADPDAQQEEIDNLADELKAALDVLKNKVDKTALQELYDQYKNTANVNYTEESWSRFQNALAKAGEILEANEADEAMVAEALAELEAAYTGLKEKEPVTAPDKTKLRQLYDSNVNREKGNYTEASWKQFQAALALAKQVLADDEADQQMVDEALAYLQAAVAGLREKEPGKTPDPGPKPGDKDKDKEAGGTDNKPGDDKKGPSGSKGKASSGTSGKGASDVKTGDQAATGGYLLLLALAFGAAVISSRRKKKNFERS